MNRIWNRIYLGDIDDAVGLSTANPNQISCVINCTTQHLGIDIPTVAIPIDDETPVPEEMLWTAIRELRTALERGQTVLIHCRAGASRSPSILAAYLYVCGFGSFEDCLIFLRSKRDIVCPNAAIVDSIRKLLHKKMLEGRPLPPS